MHAGSQAPNAFLRYLITGIWVAARKPMNLSKTTKVLQGSEESLEHFSSDYKKEKSFQKSHPF